MTPNPDDSYPFSVVHKATLKHYDDVPGQLELIPDNLEAELARITAEQDRLRALKAEHTLRAVSRVVAATENAAAARAALDDAVADARAAGATWEQVGRAAGMTRQSARERWGR